MQMNRWKAKLGAALGALILSGAALAQAWPAKPVKLIVPFAPGSGTDFVARAMADEFSKSLGQQFVVENKPGASAQLAAETVVKSAPDGYTLFVTTNTAHSANPHLFKKLNYDPIKDFTPIARTIFLQFMIVVDPKLPIKTTKDLADHIKANPGKVSYAYANSSGQVAGAAFLGALKSTAIAVPYKSSPAAMTDVAGGQVSFMFTDLASGMALVKGGRLRALSVAGEKRSTILPELPTIGETAGFEGFDVVSWGAVMGPAGLPKDVVDKMHAEIRKVYAKPEFREKLAGQGFEVALGNPDELSAFLKSQLESWGQKIRAAGIQPE